MPVFLFFSCTKDSVCRPQYAIINIALWAAFLLRKELFMETRTQSPTAPVCKTYRVEDIAEMLDIGRSSAYELVKQGHFKTVRIGTAIRISKKSFDEWLETHEYE